MEIDYSDCWTEYKREGAVGRFQMQEPLRMYERDDSNARIIISPVVPSVPPEESPVTAEKLREDYGQVLPGHPGEYIQSILYAAMITKGEPDEHLIARDPDDFDLPAMFSDAPISDERFADLNWTITVQYMLQAFRPDEEMPRPTTRPTPEVSFQFNNREQAVETLEALLSTETVEFDLPMSIS